MSDQKRLDIHNSSVPVLCQACEARHKGVCGAMTPDELTRLSRHTTIRQHPAKTILVTEEEPVKSYANLLNGVVKLSKTMADGRQQIVGLQFAPDFVGRPFHSESQVCAEAASNVTLCYFPKNAVEAMLKEQPELERRLLRQAPEATFDLPLTRTDIADFLGLTIETVSRQLTKMRKADVIRVENNRHIIIPSLSRLREISGN